MICNYVKIEAPLSPLSGESFIREKAGNIQDSARVNLITRGLWTAGQKAFFDVRVFNRLAKRYCKQNLEKCYEINEE